jgi:ectoine hydroxylase-related dioxygenase (phytanoyl-CoA dioxygenase family)
MQDASPASGLTDAQRNYFHTFGYLVLPGVFASEMNQISDAFEAAFAAHDTPYESHERIHGQERRLSLPNVMDDEPTLAKLPQHPRIQGVARSLFGDEMEFAGSDANLYFCDTLWHSDVFGSPIGQFHVKFSLYLDPVDAENGAIRVIPGSQFIGETYSSMLRRTFRNPEDVPGLLGADAESLPAVVLASKPGDVVLWNYRLIHASFGGRDRRRHISFGFREPTRQSDN